MWSLILCAATLTDMALFGPLRSTLLLEGG
jgi:hypothetical protein